MGKTSSLVSVSLLALASVPGWGSTWYVDGSLSASGDGTAWATAFKKIQEAIDAALDGDTLIVAQGTYVENIHFKGKNIVLRSTDPLDPTVVASTIIDGNQTGTVVTFAGTERKACGLFGLTVRNGKAMEGGGILGGSDQTATEAPVEHCVIVGNSASFNGGGIAYCRGPIRNSSISGNTAMWGGGLFMCDGIIENNTIAANSAGNGYGGGICDCDGPIRNNRITDNSAGEGGAIAVCGGDILCNTIAGNSALYGALFDCFGTISNCVIWANATLQLKMCPAVVSFCCVEDWTGGGEGNLSEDPRFVDADGPDNDPGTHEDNDYRLLPHSPCVDAGNNEDWMGTALDLDACPRIVHGIADIGAYEFHSRVQFVGMGFAGEVGLAWTSPSGWNFAVWSSSDLLTGMWAEEATVPSQGPIAWTWWADASPVGEQKFYRIEMK